MSFKTGEVIIMEDLTFIIIVSLVILLSFLLAYQFKILQEKQDLYKKYHETLRNMETRARDLFEYWRENELENQKKVLTEGVKREYESEFREWKANEEKGIREDAINKSRAVIMGKVTEHIMPYFEDFKYNPKDARFIGTPVDFIVFDGMCDGKVRQIVFVEVKTGKTGQLSKTEKQVRDAVTNRKVTWDKIHYNGKESP